jgi:hypothetical protein
MHLCVVCLHFLLLGLELLLSGSSLATTFFGRFVYGVYKTICITIQVT